jgi:hypothetical protein
MLAQVQAIKLVITSRLNGMCAVGFMTNATPQTPKIKAKILGGVMRS